MAKVKLVSVEEAKADRVLMGTGDGAAAWRAKDELVVTVKDAWSSTVAYVSNTIVTHTDQAWLSKEATLAGEEPGVSSKWLELPLAVDTDHRGNVTDPHSTVPAGSANDVVLLDGAGAFSAQGKPVVDVRDKGADPTAAASSAQAIRDALAAGDSVLITDGTYLVDSVVDIGANKHLHLAANAKVVVPNGYTGTVFRMTGRSGFNPSVIDGRGKIDEQGTAQNLWTGIELYVNHEDTSVLTYGRVGPVLIERANVGVLLHAEDSGWMSDMSIDALVDACVIGVEFRKTNATRSYPFMRLRFRTSVQTRNVNASLGRPQTEHGFKNVAGWSLMFLECHAWDAATTGATSMNIIHPSKGIHIIGGEIVGTDTGFTDTSSPNTTTIITYEDNQFGGAIGMRGYGITDVADPTKQQDAATKASAVAFLAGLAVSRWTTRTSAADNTWYSVCWSPELSLFCAVSVSGTGNRVMTSPDGITWTTRTSAADNQWTSVCWSPELDLFCAVANTGTGDRVMTSPDGITWTARTSAADNEWFGVTWSPDLSLFCAVAATGTGDRVMTSPDGVTWTSRTSAVDVNWRSVCWSPEKSLFVAVANGGTGNRVMTSPDGITWTDRVNAISFPYSVAWSPGLNLFCAVASSGTGNRVMTSPDGVTWTARVEAAANSWLSVTWADELGLFVAVSTSGTGDRVMTSPDGITWTSRTSAVDNQWGSVAWAPELGLFAAVSQSGTGDRVMTSDHLTGR